MNFDSFSGVASPSVRLVAGGTCVSQLSHEPAMSWPGLRQHYAQSAGNKRAKTTAGYDQFDRSTRDDGNGSGALSQGSSQRWTSQFSEGYCGRSSPVKDVMESPDIWNHLDVAPPVAAQRAHSAPVVSQLDQYLAPGTPPMLNSLPHASPSASPPLASQRAARSATLGHRAWPRPGLLALDPVWAMVNPVSDTLVQHDGWAPSEGCRGHDSAVGDPRLGPNATAAAAAGAADMQASGACAAPFPPGCSCSNLDALADAPPATPPPPGPSTPSSSFASAGPLGTSRVGCGPRNSDGDLEAVGDLGCLLPAPQQQDQGALAPRCAAEGPGQDAAGCAGCSAVGAEEDQEDCDGDGDDPSLVVTLMVLQQVGEELEAGVGRQPQPQQWDWEQQEMREQEEGEGQADGGTEPAAAAAAAAHGSPPEARAAEVTMAVAVAVPPEPHEPESAVVVFLPFDLQSSALWRVGPPRGRPPLPPRLDRLGARRMSLAPTLSSELSLISATAASGGDMPLPAAGAGPAAGDATVTDAHTGASPPALPCARAALVGGDSPFGRRQPAPAWGQAAQDSLGPGTQPGSGEPTTLWGGSAWTRQHSPFADLASRPAGREDDDHDHDSSNPVPVPGSVSESECGDDWGGAVDGGAPRAGVSLDLPRLAGGVPAGGVPAGGVPAAAPAAALLPPSPPLRPASPTPGLRQSAFTDSAMDLDPTGPAPAAAAAADSTTAAAQPVPAVWPPSPFPPPPASALLSAASGRVDAAAACAAVGTTGAVAVVAAATLVAVVEGEEEGEEVVCGQEPMDDDELDEYYLNTLCGGRDPLAAFMQQEERKAGRDQQEPGQQQQQQGPQQQQQGPQQQQQEEMAGDHGLPDGQAATAVLAGEGWETEAKTATEGVGAGATAGSAAGPWPVSPTAASTIAAAPAVPVRGPGVTAPVDPVDPLPGSAGPQPRTRPAYPPGFPPVPTFPPPFSSSSSTSSSSSSSSTPTSGSPPSSPPPPPYPSAPLTSHTTTARSAAACTSAFAPEPQPQPQPQDLQTPPASSLLRQDTPALPLSIPLPALGLLVPGAPQAAVPYAGHGTAAERPVPALVAAAAGAHTTGSEEDDGLFFELTLRDEEEGRGGSSSSTSDRSGGDGGGCSGGGFRNASLGRGYGSVTPEGTYQSWSPAAGGLAAEPGPAESGAPDLYLEAITSPRPSEGGDCPSDGDHHTSAGSSRGVLPPPPAPPQVVVLTAACCELHAVDLRPCQREGLSRRVVEALSRGTPAAGGGPDRGEATASASASGAVEAVGAWEGAARSGTVGGQPCGWDRAALPCALPQRQYATPLASLLAHHTHHTHTQHAVQPLQRQHHPHDRHVAQGEAVAGGGTWFAPPHGHGLGHDHPGGCGGKGPEEEEEGEEGLLVVALERVGSCAHCSVAADVRRLVGYVVWASCFGAAGQEGEEEGEEAGEEGEQ